MFVKPSSVYRSSWRQHESLPSTMDRSSTLKLQLEEITFRGAEAWETKDQEQRSTPKIFPVSVGRRCGGSSRPRVVARIGDARSHFNIQNICFDAEDCRTGTVTVPEIGHGLSHKNKRVSDRQRSASATTKVSQDSNGLDNERSPYKCQDGLDNERAYKSLVKIRNQLNSQCISGDGIPRITSSPCNLPRPLGTMRKYFSFVQHKPLHHTDARDQPSWPLGLTSRRDATRSAPPSLPSRTNILSLHVPLAGGDYREEKDNAPRPQSILRRYSVERLGPPQQQIGSPRPASREKSRVRFEISTDVIQGKEDVTPVASPESTVVPQWEFSPQPWGQSAETSLPSVPLLTVTAAPTEWWKEDLE